MKAIAILRVDPEVAETALEGVSLQRLDDCVLLPLEMSLASEPAQLGARVRELAGPVVELHREPRGVPVMPDTYALKATTWAAAIEELGEAADWVQPAASQPMGGMDGLLAAFGGAMGQGAPDMGALAAQLQGEQGAALLEQAMQMAQQLAQTGALADLASAMAPPGAAPAEGAIDPAAALAQMAADPSAVEGMDLEAMNAQAQSMMQGVDLNAMAQQAQAMLAGNPALERQLQEQLGAMLEPPPRDEEE